MSITARHKKPGAFKLLVHSLETTVTDKRQKIIDAIRTEDKQMAEDVEKSIFNFDEFINLPDMVLAEVISAFQGEARTLALALYKKNEKLIEKFKKNMIPLIGAEFRDVFEQLDKVRVSEHIGAQFRIIAKARELQTRGTFTLKKYAGTYPN